VFSYMASFYVIPSEVEESLDHSGRNALLVARNGSNPIMPQMWKMTKSE
jgi:hypothetical protein